MRVTKEVKGRIKEIVKTLPQIKTGHLVPMRQQILGSRFIEMRKQEALSKGKEFEYPRVKNKRGETVPIKPDEFYFITISEVALVNHNKKLAQAWEKGGIDGINEYITMTKNLAIKQKKEETASKDKSKK